MEVKILDQMLMCPRCDFNYINQVEVEVWEREEDAANGVHCCVTRDSATCDGDASHKNPSARRQATAIVFQCEECAELSVLAIRQHKGKTFVEWRPYEKGGA